MMRTRTWVKPEMTSVPGHDTMYAFPLRFLSRHLSQCIFKVRRVPHHLRHRSHVCRDAAYGLVCRLSLYSLISTITILSSRNVVSKTPISGPADPDSDVYIGRSEVAMWMRVVSSWVCMLLYIWSLMAPVLLPDRCDFCHLLSGVWVLI